MKILITGAAGFIGYHLSRTLIGQGHVVIGIDSLNNYYSTKLKLDRLSMLSSMERFSFHAINICNKDELDDLFKQERFDLVINLAAQAGVRYSIDKPYKYLDSNLIGFVNVLEACRCFQVKRLLFASSSSVYGNSQDIPFTVDQNTDQPASLYAATKKANELMAYTYANLYGIKTYGLRFFTVYGPWGRPDMAYFSFTQKIFNQEPIPVFNNGNLERDFTYVDDIVKGISQLVDQFDANPNHFKVYNLGNHQPVKLLDFIHTLENHIGIKALIDYKPMQPGDVLKTYADITESINDFNYSPHTNIDEGLKHFTDWYNNYYNINS